MLKQGHNVLCPPRIGASCEQCCTDQGRVARTMLTPSIACLTLSDLIRPLLARLAMSAALEDPVDNHAMP